MLALNDPLWSKLDDAFRSQDIPRLLSEFAETWDGAAANELLWGHLCHQGTCYGATYAAIPHLLKVAQPKENPRQRFDIAVFLGHVALRAFECDEPPQGLPQTLEAWDRKLDCFRSLVASLEGGSRPCSDSEQTELLPRYKRFLALEPVNTRDLAKIQSIRAEFFASLPAIRALCEHTLLENRQDDDAVLYLLSGIAAADGLFDLASFLDYGSEGLFRCSACDWRYDYRLYGNRVAIYAEENPPASPLMSINSKTQSDYREQAPSSADGFIVPAADSQTFDPPTAALLSLSERAPSPAPALLLRNFLGSFRCCKCGAQGPMRSLK
jgi:hypothetical protein